MRFSIIIPVYFYNQFVRGMLNSLINQKFKDFEVVIVGNSISKIEFDAIQSEMKTLIKDHFVCKYIHTEKKGANNARHIGYENSSGEYVSFLDCDDQFSNAEVFEKINTIINNSNPDVITCNIQHASFNDDKIKHGKIIYNFERVDEIIEISDNQKHLTKNFGTNICARFIRRDLLINIKYLNLPYTQDWNISSKLFPRVKSFYFINEPLYLYIYRHDSISQVKSMTYDKHKETLNCIIDIVDYYKRNNLDKKYRYFLYDRIIKFCFLYISKSSFYNINEGFKDASNFLSKQISFNKDFISNKTTIMMFLLMKNKFLYKIYLKRRFRKRNILEQ